MSKKYPRPVAALETSTEAAAIDRVLIGLIVQIGVLAHQLRVLLIVHLSARVVIVQLLQRCQIVRIVHVVVVAVVLIVVLVVVYRSA